MSSPTQRSLEYFRERGYVADVVERWIGDPRKSFRERKRRDLFGFADLIAYHPERDGVVLVQATTTGNMNARLEKILSSDKARLWIQDSDRQIVVIGWKKYAKAVDRKLWRPTLRWVFPAHFGSEAA